MTDMRLQSSMGRVQENYRPDMNMGGSFSVGKVVKVHHFSGTVDVEIVNSRDMISSSTENKGKYAARVMTQGAWFDETGKQKYWGRIEPMAEGSLVVLGFLDGMKSRPVIFGQLHRGDNPENVLPSQYPLKEKQAGFHRREALKSLCVYPSMGYSKVDGEGNMEFVTSSKSFFAAYNTSMDAEVNMTDGHDSFDHEHLSEINKKTGNVFETDVPESQTPMKFLFVHRDAFTGSNRRTKIFISEKGMVRTTRDNDDGKLSYTELREDGTLRVRRQLDDSDHGEGENNTELTITPAGELSVKRQNGNDVVSMTLTEDCRMLFSNRIQLDNSDDLPSPSDALRGTIAFVKGPEGVDDSMMLCKKVVEETETGFKEIIKWVTIG
ncbi:hypothetical protein D3C74_50820 [compost metagenome]